MAFSNMLFGEMINVGIFYQVPVQSFIFTVEAGNYVVYTEKGKLLDINNEDILQISYVKKQISIKSIDKDLGVFNEVKIIGSDYQNTFKIKPNQPSGSIKYYDDNLFVRRHNYYDYLQLINNIDIDNYVAGVVESEVGKSPPEEYFKLQSIICRTYALKNIDRHADEGFSVCDRVHCQAYHGKPNSILIKKATLNTHNIVIVDSDINLITATFYSNCGGQTANSEDVWHKDLYYLKSRVDTFCIHSNNAIWQKKIPIKSWENYLLEHQFPKDDLHNDCSLEYFQNSREKFYEKQNIEIPLVEIRKDWNLKSAYFDIEQIDNFVIFKGKGFGHGVGLCQEGAMEMAKDGYSFLQILHFYYADVHMINLSAIDFFKADF